jgi:uncharacterized repeat protein (TIGR03803 family)
MTCRKLSRSKLALAVSICAVVTLVLNLPAHAQTETVLYSFGSAPPSPNYPNYGMILDSLGNLYGVSASGGAYGYGSVFEVARNRTGEWSERTIHSFNNEGSGGYTPEGGIAMDSAGNIYGTASEGGSRRAGTVFELVRQSNGSWEAKLLYAFGASASDGKAPAGGLTIDSSGNLYGSTNGGGADNYGTVFELSASSGGWTEKVIHSFSGYPHDGVGASGTLVFNSTGSLFGTTATGGGYKEGTVYELIPSSSGGWTEKILHAFAGNQTDGGEPTAGVIMDSAGNLYGTTNVGGSQLFGTVFELTPATDGRWTERILYSFEDNGTDGISPISGVTFDAEGDLYGAAGNGGVYGHGTVFELTPDGAGNWIEAIVWAFNDTDGNLPLSGLTIDAAGNLYGETTNGGSSGYGTVYEIVP